jgi:hypothetical protein
MATRASRSQCWRPSSKRTSASPATGRRCGTATSSSALSTRWGGRANGRTDAGGEGGWVGRGERQLWRWRGSACVRGAPFPPTTRPFPEKRVQTARRVHPLRLPRRLPRRRIPSHGGIPAIPWPATDPYTTRALAPPGSCPSCGATASSTSAPSSTSPTPRWEKGKGRRQHKKGAALCPRSQPPTCGAARPEALLNPRPCCPPAPPTPSPATGPTHPSRSCTGN